MLKRTWPYDMWSLGVSWLEVVMGTPHVFQVDPRTRVKLYHQLRMDAMSDVRLSYHTLIGIMLCRGAHQNASQPERCHSIGPLSLGRCICLWWQEEPRTPGKAHAS